MGWLWQGYFLVTMVVEWFLVCLARFCLFGFGWFVTFAVFGFWSNIVLGFSVVVVVGVSVELPVWGCFRGLWVLGFL